MFSIFSALLEENIFSQCPPKPDLVCGLAAWLLVPLPVAELCVFSLRTFLQTRGNILKHPVFHFQKWTAQAFLNNVSEPKALYLLLQKRSQVIHSHLGAFFSSALKLPWI